ncbi:MAG: polyhydroxyalkanoate synthesis repressor PhaR [Rubrivivax sp.]|nr:polyhydroxyalkanoate synthesis repressor PhaR [Rubrivivax sp.]MDP3612261.1 polyhydroxyalkanoate synthesis repressor PhaR [Rubrivivax sp.]
MPTSRRSQAPAPEAEGTKPVRVLKKYPNRRLYDTQTSSYITLADVKQMVLAGEDFEVRDAKSADDLTRSILLQIILEEESGGVPMFSAATLSQIIRFYGHAMQGVMGSMLEQNMSTFAELQKQFVAQSAGLYDPKRMNPELWSQFMSAQPTALQGLMGSYVEQSRAMIEKMQEAGSLFPGMSGFPPKR